MEFEVGFQTASNSVIKCQGQDILLEGSIQKGIVQHVEYVIQVEREVFKVTGDKIMAMISVERLPCNPLGPAAGCVGALHTLMVLWKRLTAETSNHGNASKNELIKLILMSSLI